MSVFNNLCCMNDEPAHRAAAVRNPILKVKLQTQFLRRIQLEQNPLTHPGRTETWDCGATESAWLLQTPLTFNPLHRRAKPFLSLWKSAAAVSVIYTTSLPEDSRNKEQLIDCTAKYNRLIPLWHPVGEWVSHSAAVGIDANSTTLYNQMFC